MWNLRAALPSTVRNVMAGGPDSLRVVSGGRCNVHSIDFRVVDESLGISGPSAMHHQAPADGHYIMRYGSPNWDHGAFFIDMCSLMHT